VTAEVPPSELPPTATPLPTAPSRGADPLSDPRTAQILATEHWSLLAGRSLAYNEAFSRAGMFLTFLSASLIVMGFAIATDRFADAVVPIVALLLAVDLFIGLATLGRLIDAGSEELVAIAGMNRIRHAYTEMIPGIQRYFIASIHDDARGILSSFGTLGVGEGPPSPFSNIAHGLTTTVGMVAVINCVITGALVAVIALGLGADSGLALVLGVGGFVALFALTSFLGVRTALTQPVFKEPMFPRPPES
jgi:hypothetical protein